MLPYTRKCFEPPVADKPLYHAKPTGDIGEEGHETYRMFDKVVKLTVNQRVQGMSSEQVIFRDLLLRLRKGQSTVDDWKLLLSRQPAAVSNLSEFDDAIRLEREQLTFLQLDSNFAIDVEQVKESLNFDMKTF